MSTYIDDETFARLVADNVKNKTSNAQNKFLELPDNNPRWQEALNSLIDTLNDQINEISHEAKESIKRYSEAGDISHDSLTRAMAHGDTRKQKIERFRFYVEKKLSEVQSAADPYVDADPRSFFIRAIRKHQEMSSYHKIENTPLDIALYDSLNGVWSFDKIRESDLEDFSNYASTV